MRIGQEDNFLSIQLFEAAGVWLMLTIDAVASVSGRRFTASHDRVGMNSSSVEQKAFADFESLKVHAFDIELSESGWLRFRRDLHGCIMVQYRIAGWKASAAMEGEVIVTGEFSGQFCREFGALLMGKPAPGRFTEEPL